MLARSGRSVAKTLFIVALLGLWREASAQGFGPKTDFAVVSGPFWVAIGDLNGDGKLDLAVPNAGSNNVSVLLGTGGGSFGAKTDFTTGANPRSLAIGDLNGDGRPDLAVANNNNPGTVSVLLGTGSGSFGAKTDFVTGNTPHSVAIGDLNGDGKLDLAVANQGGAVSVLLGTGGGSFAARTDFTAGTIPWSVAIGDLNGDGKPDLAVANFSSNTVSVLLGTGGGSFGVNSDFATGTNPFSVAIGDLNSDGKPDLAVANNSADVGNTVSVLLGTGSGTFGAKTDFTTGSGPRCVAIADVDGDGKPDLVVANRSSNAVSVLLGTGGGSFGAKTDFATGSLPQLVAIGDMNGDGRPDLAVANGISNTVSVLLNTYPYPPPPRVFGPKADYAVGSLPNGIAIGDLNGDGKPDLVSADGDFSKVSVLLGAGAGLFGPKTNFTTGTGGPTSAAIADLNADGKPDLAVTMWGSNTVSALLGTGTGSFAPFTEFTTGGFPFSVAVGDLNGDGKPDLAAADQNSSTVSVLLGTGGGSFGLSTDFVTGNTPRSVAMGDLNGDGKLDLATANSFGNTVSVLLGTGTGSFGAKTDFTTGTGPRSVAIGDLNGDGKPDLAVANENSNTVSVLLGTGGGSFGAKTDFATAANPRSVAIGDLNGDGLLDLAAANFGSNTASVLLGNGAGSFGAKSDFTTGASPNAVVIADLNGDGQRDLAVLDNGGAISVLLNTTDTTPPTVHVTTPNGGETINGGATKSIGWTASDAFGVNHVDLYYSLDGSATYTLIATNRPNSTYSWSVPLIPTNHTARVKVVAFDASGNSAEDASDTDFTIQDAVAPTITIVTPTAGEIVPTGYGLEISWHESDNVGVDHVVLELSYDGGTTVGPLATVAATEEAYVWTTPLIATDSTVRIRATVYDASGNSSAFTTGNFTVNDGSPPLVHLDSPNGGETIGKGTATKIAWTASDNVAVDHVDLYYSLDSGATDTLIAASQPNTGTYAWSVPTIATILTARVEVVAFDASGNGAADTSDADFTIQDANAPLVHVDSPNGGEILSEGGAFKIAWTASDNIVVDHVDLYGSVDGGATYSPIAASEANDGTYAWTIPATLTTQGRVRVVAFDASGNGGEDASDADFTIVDATPPATPTPFAGVFTGGPVQLHWGANAEPDFAVYHLHRGSTAGFVPGLGNLVVSQADTGYVDAGSTWSYYKLSALDGHGNESGFAEVAPGGSSTGPTPPGSNVPVSPSPTVGLTFQHVTGGGQTQLTLQTGGSPPPGGLRISPSSPPLYYVITTTATFTDTVTVCVNYDPEFITGQEKNLKLMHYDTALQPPAWVPITSSRDTAANLICGTVTHFSEFALMETDENVAVEEETPSAIQLYACAPNPVSGPAQVLFDLPLASPVRLGLYDLQGRLVRDLERSPMANAGRHSVRWDGRGAHGEQLRAGVYFLWLEAGGVRQMRRVAVVK